MFIDENIEQKEILKTEEQTENKEGEKQPEQVITKEEKQNEKKPKEEKQPEESVTEEEKPNEEEYKEQEVYKKKKKKSKNTEKVDEMKITEETVKKEEEKLNEEPKEETTIKPKKKRKCKKRFIDLDSFIKKDNNFDENVIKDSDKIKYICFNCNNNDISNEDLEKHKSHIFFKDYDNYEKKYALEIIDKFRKKIIELEMELNKIKIKKEALEYKLNSIEDKNLNKNNLLKIDYVNKLFFECNLKRKNSKNIVKITNSFSIFPTDKLIQNINFENLKIKKNIENNECNINYNNIINNISIKKNINYIQFYTNIINNLNKINNSDFFNINNIYNTNIHNFNNSNNILNINNVENIINIMSNINNMINIINNNSIININIFNNENNLNNSNIINKNLEIIKYINKLLEQEKMNFCEEHHKKIEYYCIKNNKFFCQNCLNFQVQYKINNLIFPINKLIDINNMINDFILKINLLVNNLNENIIKEKRKDIIVKNEALEIISNIKKKFIIESKNTLFIKGNINSEKLNQNNKYYNFIEKDNSNLTEIIQLMKDIKQKDNEIMELKSRYPIELLKGEKLISLNFSSSDEEFHFSLICKNTDIFSKIEGMIYNEFPEYKEYNNSFTCNGNIINKYKTLDENKIKNNDIINLISLN